MKKYGSVQDYNDSGNLMSYDTRFSQNQSADNLEPNEPLNNLNPASTEHMISKGAIDIIPDII